MARYEYGQSADSTVAEPIGDNLTLADGVTVTFWNAVTAGTQYTALVDVDGSTPVGPTFTIGASGILPRFLGPDGVAFMWLDAGFTNGVRVRVPGQWVPGSVVAASETVAGIARRATQAETNAGVIDTPFVSPLKLALTTLFGKAKNDSVSLTGSIDTAGDYTIVDDSTTQTTWPFRWSMLFGAIRTGHFDKYGQTRANAAKATTTAFRVENRNASPTANLIEAGIGAADVLFGVSAAGVVTAPNVGAKVLVLSADAPVPAATPDGTLIVRTTVLTGGNTTATLITDHLHEGTVGTSPTASQEGYTNMTGAAPVYVTGGYVGTAALRWAGVAAQHADDSFPAQAGDLHVRLYFRPISYTSTMTFAQAVGTSNLTSIRFRTSDLVLWDNAVGSTGTGGTPAGTKPALNSWSRLEWQIGLTGTSLKIWTTNPASTGTPDQTLTMNYVTALTERPTLVGFGQWAISNSTVDIDAVAVGTSPIGPAA